MPLSVGVSCGQLVDPSNGRVDTSAGTSFGDVARYSCDTGYTRNGPAERTCQANGEWSGSAPTCDSEYTLFMCPWMWTEQFPHTMSGSHISEWIVIPKNSIHSCNLLLYHNPFTNGLCIRDVDVHVGHDHSNSDCVYVRSLNCVISHIFDISMDTHMSAHDVYKCGLIK